MDSVIVMQPRTALESAGPSAILVFGASRRCDQFDRLSQKLESIPLWCEAPPQMYIVCRTDIGSTIALDLQQK